MTNDDPTRTLHDLVARTIGIRALNRHSTLSDETPETLADRARQQLDPGQREVYLLVAQVGWMVLGFWVCVAIFATAFVTRELFGEQAAVVVISLLAAPCFFCVAGAWNVIWRYYWYVPQAKRRGRRDGVSSERFAVSMRRTLPPRRSVVWMSVLGVAASIVTYAAL